MSAARRETVALRCGQPWVAGHCKAPSNPLCCHGRLLYRHQHHLLDVFLEIHAQGTVSHQADSPTTVVNRLVHHKLLPLAEVKSVLQPLQLNQEILERLGLLLQPNQDVVHAEYEEGDDLSIVTILNVAALVRAVSHHLHLL